MIKSRHTLSYCNLCETEMIRCARCNNNCCNGTYGTNLDGTWCVDCPEAYDHQDLYWKNAESVIFSADIRNSAKLIKIVESGDYREN